jgi:hypothetical protein
MHKKIIFLLLITAFFSGCSKQIIKQGNPNNAQSTKDNQIFDCKSNEKNFSDYSWFFKDKDYITWCEECKDKNGKPQISHDGGPFCNIKTNDAGKKCTDSSQCEGHCIAETINDSSGFCTDYKELSDGCGWFELINGKASELCVS